MYQTRDAAVAVLLLVLVFCYGGESSELEVMTQSGKVQGVTKATGTGKSVDAFLGIPYGAPTGGRNRFAPPKEREPWAGTFDATDLPAPCYQVIPEQFNIPAFTPAKPHTEDCLMLNIWVPKPRPVKSAVLVWIYGGGFSSGTSDLALYDGSILASEEDVIVVSMNYRLSAFGFLYLGHPDAPGNVGLMDQALAFQWVRKNIKAFGGDPERVTIFGESAGGASVGFHLVLPTSLDLFKNAVLSSGAAVAMWATVKPEKALRQSLALLEQAGCPVHGNNKDEALRCLQDMNVEKFLEILVAMEDEPLEMMFRPLADGKYLTNEPSDLMSKGKFCSEKNVLLGYNVQDGSFLIPIVSGLPVTEDGVYTEEQVRNTMSKLTQHREAISSFQSDLVKYVYTAWDSSPDNMTAHRDQLIHFLTDRWFSCAALETADRFSDKGNKVFLYRFDFVGQGISDLLKLPAWIGCTHGNDLMYIFGHPLNNKEAKGTNEERMAKSFMRYLANFAKNGDPSDDYLHAWPKYTRNEKLRLRLDAPVLKVDKADRLKECAFWNNVFPKTFSLDNED